MDLRVTSRTIGDRLVVALDGVADLASVPVLQSQLQRALATDTATVLAIELDGLLALDDVALGLLLGAAARAREAGKDLEVVCTDPRLRGRLHATRFDRAVTVRDAIG